MGPMNSSLRLLCLSTLLAIFGFAGVQPLAVTLMEQQGLGATEIGLLSALIFGGVLVLAPFQPALVGRFGAMRSYQAGKFMATLGFVGCAGATSPWAWAGGMLLLGFGGALTWPLTDSLLASEAPPEKKGAWLALFQTGMGLAFALGPFVSAALVAWPRAVFLGAAAVCALSSIPLLGRRLPAPVDDDDGGFGVWRSAAGLALIAFLGGLFENGMHTVGTLVALASGWSGAAAVALPGVIAVGALVIQYPLGHVADRRGTRGVLLLSLAGLVLSVVALPLMSLWPPLLWILGFWWGAADGCLYTLAMTGTAQDFPVRQVASVTTLMVISYTVGSVIGPVLGGFAVDAGTLWGVVAAFGPLALLGWFITLRRRTAR